MAVQSITRIERSPEATILASLQFLGGITTILIGLIVLVLLRESVAVYSISMFIFGSGALVTGWGLWTTKDWAYRITKFFIIIFLVLAILSLPIGFILLIINVFLFYYQTRPEIKEIFNISGG